MQSTEIEWQELLSKTEFIGGEAEMHESGDDFCGPIQEFSLNHGILSIILSRTARRVPDHEWEWIETEPSPLCSINTTLQELPLPRLNDDGTISLSIFMIGPVTLRPKGQGELDYSRVRATSTPA